MNRALWLCRYQPEELELVTEWLEGNLLPASDNEQIRFLTDGLYARAVKSLLSQKSAAALEDVRAELREVETVRLHRDDLWHPSFLCVTTACEEDRVDSCSDDTMFRVALPVRWYGASYSPVSSTPRRYGGCTFTCGPSPRRSRACSSGCCRPRRRRRWRLWRISRG